MKDFIKNSLKIYQISPKDTHIGLVQYADNANIRLPLWSGSDKKEIEKMLGLIKLTGGVRKISTTLEKISKDMFITTGGARKEASQQLILLTAGKSNADEKVAIQEAVEDLERKKVNLVIINVGDDNIVDIIDAVKNPDKIITINPDEMTDVIGEVEKEIGKSTGKILKNLFS